jgi:polyisoprenoid-binding protein YceI
MEEARLAKKIAAVVGILLVIVAILVGRVVYSYLKPPATPSGSIQAIPLVQNTPTATSGAPAASSQAQATSTQPTSAQASSSTAASSASAAGAASAGPATTTPAASAQATGAPTLFEISQDSSEARFRVDEVLNGENNTVVGATNQVAGQISTNPTAPGTAQVGVIQINARTLKTDSERRDASVQNQILKTEANEYITFTPTKLVGLPQSATLGQSYTFQIVGQLAIAGQTHEATFDVTVTPTADGKLQGSAKTTIKYADWGLSIPSVPFVASVEDTVILELDFVALPKK